MAEAPWMIVGLGNPGEQYARTRHNVGFRVANTFASVQNLTFPSSPGAEAVVAVGKTRGRRLVVATPMHGMNASGGPVKALMHFYHVPVGQLIVVHDDLDLPFGVVRAKQGAHNDRHNGLRSITAQLGMGDYPRVRCGIGRPPQDVPVLDYVLGAFPDVEEDQRVWMMIALGVDVVNSIVLHGIQATQNQYNGASRVGA